VTLTFDVNQFGQIQGKLLLMKPGVVVSGTPYTFSAAERKLPVKLERSLSRDRITIQLPTGFQVDEMPEPAELQTPYGTYRARYSQAGGTLHFEQSLEVTDLVAPPQDYPKVRDFFDRVAGYQQSLVVLVKQ